MSEIETKSTAEEQESSSLAKLDAKHRQEVKALQSKTMQLKKSVTKGDNKRKKEITAEIQKVEQELKEKHKLEMENFEKNKEQEKQEHSSASLPENEEKEKDSPPQSQRVSKAQKRREKKEKEQKAKDERVEVEMEQDRMNSQKTKELELLDRRLAELKLEIFNIPADGNCLYAAVAHQLSEHSNSSATVVDLRVQCSNYMRDHSDEFLAFLTNESGDFLNGEQFEKYCKNVEGKNGPVWGGAVELGALSKALSLKIRVLQANAEDLLFGEEEGGVRQELVIIYQQHAFRLGEHYNSTVLA